MAAIRTQKEIRQRAPWLLFGLLALNFALMTYDARDEMKTQGPFRAVVQSVVSPIQRGASGIGNWIGGFFGGVGELRRASVENQHLRAQVEQMQTELRNTREKAAEAERLEKLLNLSTQVDFKTVAARVIARDSSIWFDSVSIDKGRSSGVQINMPVVTSGGIVGRVVSTGPFSAQVMLITDEKSGAGAVVGQLGQSNAIGSIRGLGKSGLLDMRYVSGMEKVQLGETVFTTGQDGIYPPGFSIGQVVEVRAGSATQTQVIHIRPSAGVDRLKEVVVLQYAPSKRVDMDQSLPNVDKKKQ